MRALVVAPRLPGTGFSGDRLRVGFHLDALASAGFETVLVGGVPIGTRSRMLEKVAVLHGVPLGSWRSPASLVAASLNGRPLQSALFAGAWADALRRAGPRFDLVVVTLVRHWPYLAGRLPACPLVVDYIDSLSGAASEAAGREPTLWRKLYWRLETERLRQAEESAALGAAATLAVSGMDLASLPEGTRALFHGVELRDRPGSASRPPIVAFTGRLAYRPNELAATWLARAVWPRVRLANPEARLTLAGADAPRSVRQLGRLDGVEVVSPVEDMPALLRRVRVACLPVSMGAGIPNKLFEAFEAGAAVVASRQVVQRGSVDCVPPPARSAATVEEYAEGISAYLRDPGLAVQDGMAGRRYAEQHADRRHAVEKLAALYRRVVEGAA